MPVERRLWRESPAARRFLYVAAGLAFLAAALWLAFVWLLSEVVNRAFVIHQTLNDICELLAAMLALLLVRAGLMWASDLVAQHAANGVKRDMRVRLMAKLVTLGPGYTRGERTGELVHLTVDGVEALDEYIGH